MGWEQGGGKGPRPPKSGVQFPKDGGGKRPPSGGKPQRSAREERGASSEFVVEGLPALTEYAKFRPTSVLEIRATSKDVDVVKGLVREHGLTAKINVAEVRADEPGHWRSDADDDPLAASRSPIAARLKLEPLNEAAWRDKLAAQPESFVVALDHVHDPRNLGAIARSAGFFGLRSLLVPERRQVLLTQASVATAQGGFALCELVVCTNLGRALEGLKEAGYWIIGADMTGEPIAKLAGQYDKVVLVLGNEETGIAQHTRAKCDRMVAIGGARGAGGQGLESLNVSVAAGILMAGLVKV